MLKIIFAVVFFVISFFCCYFSFFYLNKRIQIKNSLINSKYNESVDIVNNKDNVEEQRIKLISKSTASMCSFIISLISFCLGLVIFDNIVSLLSFWRIVFLCVIAYGIAIIDFKLKIIPNIYVLIFIAGSVVFHIIDFVQKCKYDPFSDVLKSFFFNNILLSIVVIIVLWIVSSVMHGGMGYGDIKFLGVLCFFNGIGSLIFSLTVALSISLLVGCILLLIKKKRIKDDIPFGPFLACGIVLCAFLGLL